MASINITNRLKHKSVVRNDPNRTRESYRDWCLRNPPYLQSTDTTTGISNAYTDERHRGMWSTMVNLGFDARGSGYVLAPRTFEEPNMVVINDSELQFFQLYAYNVNAVPVGVVDFVDFKSIANKVEEMFSKRGSRILTEVQLFVEFMRNNDPTEGDSKAFILGNYAIMKTTMRTNFLEWLSDHLKDKEDFAHHIAYNKSMKAACRSYEHRRPWRGVVCSDPTSGIYGVYKFRTYPLAEPLSLIHFIRNGLRHLPRIIYFPADFWYIMNGYFEDFFSTIQERLFVEGVLQEKQLLLFQQAPPY